MLKGRYAAVVFSITIHLMIFLLIAQTQVTPPKNKPNKIQPIKSFLYVPTSPKIAIEPLEEVKEVPSNTVAEKATAAVVEHIESNKKQEQENIAPVSKITEPLTKQLLVENEPTPPKKLTSEQIKAIAPPKRNVNKYSALKQLGQLQNKIQDQMFESEAFEYSRPKTGSIMHGTPIPAPTSIIPLTREQKKEKNSRC